MPKIELTCRFKDKLSEEEQETLKIDRLVNGEDYGDDFKFIYSPLVFEMNDVKLFNSVDKQHTFIHLTDDESFVAKLDYESFKKIYSTIMATQILSLDNFHL